MKRLFWSLSLIIHYILWSLYSGHSLTTFLSQETLIIIKSFNKVILLTSYFTLHSLYLISRNVTTKIPLPSKTKPPNMTISGPNLN